MIFFSIFHQVNYDYIFLRQKIHISQLSHRWIHLFFFTLPLIHFNIANFFPIFLLPKYMCYTFRWNFAFVDNLLRFEHNFITGYMWLNSCSINLKIYFSDQIRVVLLHIIGCQGALYRFLRSQGHFTIFS